MLVQLGTDRITYRNVLVNNYCFAWSVHHLFHLPELLLQCLSLCYLILLQSLFFPLHSLSVVILSLFKSFILHSLPFCALVLFSVFPSFATVSHVIAVIAKTAEIQHVWLSCLFFKEKKFRNWAQFRKYLSKKTEIVFYKTQGTLLKRRLRHSLIVVCKY